MVYSATTFFILSEQLLEEEDKFEEEANYATLVAITTTSRLFQCLTLQLQCFNSKTEIKNMEQPNTAKSCTGNVKVFSEHHKESKSHKKCYG